MSGQYRLASAMVVIALGWPSRDVAGAGANSDSLVEAARRGDVVAARALLQSQVDVNGASVDGTTALHWAAQLGDLDMVNLLLRRGATPNVENRYGVTPLRGACVRGSVAVVEALLKA